MGTPGERGGGDGGGGKKPRLWRQFGKSLKWRRRDRIISWGGRAGEGGGEEKSLSCLEG